VQVDVEVPEDVDDCGMQWEPKPHIQQVAKDDNFVVPWPRHSLTARGSADPTMRFFTSDYTSVLSIWLRPNV
jgi:hypothetical protein